MISLIDVIWKEHFSLLLTKILLAAARFEPTIIWFKGEHSAIELIKLVWKCSCRSIIIYHAMNFSILNSEFHREKDSSAFANADVCKVQKNNFFPSRVWVIPSLEQFFSYPRKRTIFVLFISYSFFWGFFWRFFSKPSNSLLDCLYSYEM